MNASTGKQLDNSSRKRCDKQPETTVPPAAIFGFPTSKIRDRIHALLGGINERTGVHNHHVGLRGIVRDLDPAFEQRANMISASTRFFGAAERNQSDFQRVGRDFLVFVTRTTNVSKIVGEAILLCRP